MSAALDFDNWNEIAKRGGYRPEFIERVRADRIIATQRLEAVTKLKRRFAPHWVIDIVLDTAKEHEISPADLVGECRVVKVVRARHHAFYRIKETKPALSSPQIAGWFGRDHTTVLHALACHAKVNGLPSLSGYNLDAARERNRLALRVGRRK